MSRLRAGHSILIKTIKTIITIKTVKYNTHTLTVKTAV